MGMFKKATREKLKLRMALCGPSGSGKSYTALRFAFALGDKVAAVDTEHGSLSKYQGLAPDGTPWNFDVVALKHYAPTAYTECIKEAAREGYEVLILDSLSHAWEGVGGALDQVDKKSGNKFTAWKDVTPQHRAMIDAILGAPMHIIATMRTKTEYVLEENEKGKQVPVKIGTQPVQRAGMEYEFDIVGDLDLAHTLTISKTRCPDIDGQITSHPAASFLSSVRSWLDAGAIRTEGRQEEQQDAGTEAESTQEVTATEAQEAPPSDAPGFASEEQTQQIKGLLKRLVKRGFDIEEFKTDWLAVYKVGKVAELTPEQATDCVFRLEMEIQRRDDGIPY